MIKANELRKIEPASIDAHIKEIEAKVIEAQKGGKTDVWHYKQLTIGDKKVLEEAGYTVKEQWDRNEYLVNISWLSPAPTP